MTSIAVPQGTLGATRASATAQPQARTRWRIDIEARALMMVTAMLFLGGETLHYFALALTIGILFSIYSSVLVASPLLMLMGVSREDFIKPEKSVEEVLP